MDASANLSEAGSRLTRTPARFFTNASSYAALYTFRQPASPLALAAKAAASYPSSDVNGARSSASRKQAVSVSGQSAPLTHDPPAKNTTASSASCTSPCRSSPKFNLAKVVVSASKTLSDLPGEQIIEQHQALHSVAKTAAGVFNWTHDNPHPSSPSRAPSSASLLTNSPPLKMPHSTTSSSNIRLLTRSAN
jgi:hypothetical protein